MKGSRQMNSLLLASALALVSAGQTEAEPRDVGLTTICLASMGPKSQNLGPTIQCGRSPAGSRAADTWRGLTVR